MHSNARDGPQGSILVGNAVFDDNAKAFQGLETTLEKPDGVFRFNSDARDVIVVN